MTSVMTPTAVAEVAAPETSFSPVYTDLSVVGFKGAFRIVLQRRQSTSIPRVLEFGEQSLLDAEPIEDERALVRTQLDQRAIDSIGRAYGREGILFVAEAITASAITQARLDASRTKFNPRYRSSISAVHPRVGVSLSAGFERLFADIVSMFHQYQGESSFLMQRVWMEGQLRGLYGNIYSGPRGGEPLPFGELATLVAWLLNSAERFPVRGSVRRPFSPEFVGVCRDDVEYTRD